MPVTCYPCKTHSWAAGGPPSLPPTSALAMRADHGCTFTSPAFQTCSTKDARKYSRLCSITYANSRHTGGGQQELQQTQSNFYPVGQSCMKSLSSKFDLLSKHQRQVLLGTWKGRSTTFKLTNRKELTPSLSPRIIICFGTILRHFCLFHTGLCTSLEPERWEPIPQLGHYSGVQELYFLPLQHPSPAQVNGTGHIHLLHHPGLPPGLCHFHIQVLPQMPSWSQQHVKCSHWCISGLQYSKGVALLPRNHFLYFRSTSGSKAHFMTLS